MSRNVYGLPNGQQVVVTIDDLGAAQRLMRRALKSKTKRATALGGAVVVQLQAARRPPRRLQH